MTQGDCNECGNKRYSANEWFGCTCTHTCSVPPPATPDPAEGGATTTGSEADLGAAASANLDGASLWVGSDAGKICVGKNADACLSRNDADGGLSANGNFSVAGDVVVQGTALSSSLDAIAASVDTLEASHAALDAVAVKSSSEGAQVLGEVTATSLAVSDGITATSVRLGVRDDAAPCEAGDEGTMAYNKGEQTIEVCNGAGEWLLVPLPKGIGRVVVGQWGPSAHGPAQPSGPHVMPLDQEHFNTDPTYMSVVGDDNTIKPVP